MSQELKQLTEKTIFEIYLSQYPKIIEFIRKAIKQGYTPSQIERYVLSRSGKSVVVCHIRLAANYIYDNDKTQ